MLEVVVLVETADVGDSLGARAESPFAGAARRGGGKRASVPGPGVRGELLGMATAASAAPCVLARRNAGQQQEEEDRDYQTNRPLN
ncbi:MAG: hypothetical protein HY238_18695 [Acidobacteria bacterium]|nr:hypothetical protein [Acidobacteriota bacterium]